MNGNGAHKIIYWVLGSVIAPGMLAVSGFLAKTTVENNSRITALERDTEHRLQEIEKKLDRLLER
jgi:hypothetical protein